MTSRYNPHRINMRYASPDGIRPNPDLIKRTRENFGVRNHIPRGPPPSQLPLPSPALRRQPSTKVIKGKNRTWTIRDAGKRKTKRKYKHKNKDKNKDKNKHKNKSKNNSKSK